MLDKERVLLGEGVVLLEPLDGHAEVPVLHVDVVEDGDQAFEVGVGFGEHAAGELPRLCLPDAVGRHGGRDRDHPGMRR